MALKTFKPITPSLRQLVLVDRSDLYKGKPVKTLTEGLSKSGGRNNRRSHHLAFPSAVAVTRSTYRHDRLQAASSSTWSERCRAPGI